MAISNEIPVSQEVAHWLREGMNVGEAHQDHLSRWSLLDVDDFHDFPHMLSALGGAPNYQASHESEAYANAIEKAFHPSADASTLTARGFVQDVQESASRYLSEENFNRTLLWLMGERRGMTAASIYEEFNCTDDHMRDGARKAGFILPDGDISEDWTIRTPDGRVFSPHTLPSGSNGVENFKPFKKPTENEILRVFDRVWPVMSDLAEPMRSFMAQPGANQRDGFQLLKNIAVRDLVDRMYGGSEPLKLGPVPDEVRAALERAAEQRASRPSPLDHQEEDPIGSKATRAAIAEESDRRASLNMDEIRTSPVRALLDTVSSKGEEVARGSRAAARAGDLARSSPPAERATGVGADVLMPELTAKNTHYVGVGEAGVVRADGSIWHHNGFASNEIQGSAARFIATDDVAACLAVEVRNPKTGTLGIVHVLAEHTSADPAGMQGYREMIQQLRGDPSQTLDIRVYGGLAPEANAATEKAFIDRVLNEIRVTPNTKLGVLEIGSTPHPIGAVVDAQTGRRFATSGPVSTVGQLNVALGGNPTAPENHVRTLIDTNPLRPLHSKRIPPVSDLAVIPDNWLGSSQPETPPVQGIDTASRHAAPAPSSAIDAVASHNTPIAGGESGPRASLVDTTANTPDGAQRGTGTPAQARGTNGVARAAVADVPLDSPTARLAANNNAIGANGRTAAVDAGGQNSAARHMPTSPTVAAPANDAAPPVARGGAGSAARASGAAGVGMGAYALTQRLGENGTYAHDVAVDATSANVAVAMDVAGIAAGVGEFAKGAKGFGAAGAVAGVASGVIETSIAVNQGDGRRAASAIGATSGGLVGAVAGTAAGAKIGGGIGFFLGGPPGAAIGVVAGGIIGGAAGAFGGGAAGAAAGDAVGGEAMQRYLNSNLGKSTVANLVQQLNQTGWARALGNHDSKATEAELTKYLTSHAGDKALDANHDGKITGGELQRFMQANGDTVTNVMRKEVGGLMGQVNSSGWARAVGNGDNKATIDEVMATLKEHKITMQDLDKNNDGKISGGELQRGFQAAGIHKSQGVARG